MNAIYMSELAQQYFPNSTPRSATSQPRIDGKVGGTALRTKAKGVDTVTA